ncbi:MAG: DUF6320 domain-containing protein [Acutalibacteraceae bacterium]|jgi:hypothetical protein
MSYCVNCGVELDSSAKKCALCATPVINSKAEIKEPCPVPYPDKYMIPPKVRRRYASFLATVIMLIPNIICVLVNLLVPNSGKWSIFVVSTSALLWMIVFLPMLMKKTRPLLMLTVDAVALCLYVYVFYAVYKQQGWFMGLAFPLISGLYVLVGGMLLWLRVKRDAIKVTINVFFCIAVYSMYADFFISRFYGFKNILGVSLIIASSCIALMLFFKFVEKNKRFRAWLTRKFFV